MEKNMPFCDYKVRGCLINAQRASKCIASYERIFACIDISKEKSLLQLQKGTRVIPKVEVRNVPSVIGRQLKNDIIRDRNNGTARVL